MRRIILHGEVKRRLLRIGERNSARNLGTVAANPARHEPTRRIECGGIELAQALRTVLSEAAEHCIDETGIAAGTPVRVCEPHREIDRRVIGYFEPENLCRAEQ